MTAGVDASAAIDDVQITLLERTPDVATVILYIQEQHENKGIIVDVTNRSEYAHRVTRLQRRNLPCSLQFTYMS